MRKLFLLLLFAVAAHAQTQPYIAGSVANFSNLGYRNPTASAEIGADTERPHFFTSEYVSYGLARKIETGDGRALEVGGVLCLRDRGWLVGAGDRWSREATSQWVKSAHRPVGVIGREWPRLRVLVSYLTPFLDTQNGLQGPRTTFEATATSHIHLLGVIGLYAYHDTRVAGVSYGAPAQEHAGAEIRAGIKFVY